MADTYRSVQQRYIFMENLMENSTDGAVRSDRRDSQDSRRLAIVDIGE